MITLTFLCFCHELENLRIIFSFFHSGFFPVTNWRIVEFFYSLILKFGILSFHELANCRIFYSLILLFGTLSCHELANCRIFYSLILKFGILSCHELANCRFFYSLILKFGRKTSYALSFLSRSAMARPRASQRARASALTACFISTGSPTASK